MPIDAIVLRLPIHENHHLTSCRRDTSEHHTSRASTRYAVSHHSATGDHQARNLLHEGGKDIGTILKCEFFASDGAYTEGQMSALSGHTATGYHHIAHAGLHGDAVGFGHILCPQEKRWQKEGKSNEKESVMKSHSQQICINPPPPIGYVRLQWKS